MAAKKRLTFKQKAWVKEYFSNGGNGTKAALSAYPVKNMNVAKRVAYENLRSTNVQRYMAKLLDEYGMTDEQIAQGLQKVVKAGTSRRALRGAKAKDALDAMEKMIKLKDLYPPTRIDQKSAHLRMELEGKTEGELLKVLENTKEQTRFFNEKLEEDNREKEIKAEKGDEYYYGTYLVEKYKKEHKGDKVEEGEVVASEV